MSELEKQAYELCLAIEQLPAGEYQTKLAVMASDLLQNIRAAQQLRAADVLPCGHTLEHEHMLVETGEFVCDQCGAIHH